MYVKGSTGIWILGKVRQLDLKKAGLLLDVECLSELLRELSLRGPVFGLDLNLPSGGLLMEKRDLQVGIYQKG